MKKKIIIIGSGISGLTTLHYLKKKDPLCREMDVTLLEKQSHPGGTIRSVERDGYIFETGPNGFLDNKPQTWDLIRDLNLESDVLQSNKAAKIRYISLGDTLYQLPSTPKDFFFFKPLTFLQKLRVLGEWGIPPKNIITETVYEFGQRRLGRRFTEIFLDPMVSGIYGGDAREIILSAAFPRIYQLEQEYGSLFRAMKHLKKKQPSRSDKNMAAPSGTLTSFKKGMAQIITTLSARYRKNIFLNQKVETVFKKQKQYLVCCADTQYVADELFLCLPAYEAALLMKNLSQTLSRYLMEITYAPMAVISFIFSKESFKRVPQGFGYLIPSSEKKEVLGVLFDSHIFPQRYLLNKIAFRVMIGGIRWKNMIHVSQKDLIQLALDEVKKQFSPAQPPMDTFFHLWKKAIPQYDAAYLRVRPRIEEELISLGNIYIVANYYQGISFNDCIENAYRTVQKNIKKS